MLFNLIPKMITRHQTMCRTGAFFDAHVTAALQINVRMTSAANYIYACLYKQLFKEE